MNKTTPRSAPLQGNAPETGHIGYRVTLIILRTLFLSTATTTNKEDKDGNNENDWCWVHT